MTSSASNTATNQLRVDSEVAARPDRRDRVDAIFDTAIVQAAKDEASQVAANVASRTHSAFLYHMRFSSRAESPIEAVFWIWWQTVHSLDERLHDDEKPRGAVQHAVDAGGRRYRLDFAIPDAKIAVELDGHDFHEKTKEQVTYRNMRDRDLQAAGWTVLHFSGSELLKGALGVVVSVYHLAVERIKAKQGQE
jgi:very-short-patch-repair endonuclease